ncbi:MAG: class I SAM-dependent methyltransferase [Bacteroides sp.]|jgi:ubiquinone/menaquinone biosynthesis C-methylase UbiE|nr:class I SAM-dependent methyltransferase [Bacteroides sp.]
MKIKGSVKVVRKNDLYYELDSNNRVRIRKPWLGDIFSAFYDRIMERNIFPKKFNGSIHKHFELLKNEFNTIHGRQIIEFATGSGNAVEFLNNDNVYTGIDVSAGLLRIARKKLILSGFKEPEFYVSDASDTPFAEDCFDMAICNLSLNFFRDIDAFISELQRVLKPGGTFYCSTPIPEKKKPGVKIRGTLFSAEELENKFQRQGFDFQKLPYENGSLLYFIATLREA